MKKCVLYTEVAYALSLMVLALGTALMEAGGFGVAMVAAPAYTLHLKLSPILPFFSFGVAGFCTETLALVLMMILVRRFKIGYLFTFATTGLYGLLLDGAVWLVDLIPGEGLFYRIALYVPGLLCCSAAVAMLFRCYLSPAAYELFVKEVAGKFRIPLGRFKTAFDCGALVTAVVLSLLLLGSLQGIGVGTVVCALINGTIIALFGRLYDAVFHYRDALKLRPYFEEREDSL